MILASHKCWCQKCHTVTQYSLPESRGGCEGAQIQLSNIMLHASARSSFRHTALLQIQQGHFVIFSLISRHRATEPAPNHYNIINATQSNYEQLIRNITHATKKQTNATIKQTIPSKLLENVTSHCTYTTGKQQSRTERKTSLTECASAERQYFPSTIF